MDNGKFLVFSFSCSLFVFSRLDFVFVLNRMALCCLEISRLDSSMPLGGTLPAAKGGNCEMPE